MSNSIVNFITIMHERVGDLGLTFFLSIAIIDMYWLWWLIPKQIETRVNPSKLRNSLVVLNVLRILLGIVFGMFSYSIMLTPGPALWLKILSSTLTIVLLISVLISIWFLKTSRLDENNHPTLPDQ